MLSFISQGSVLKRILLGPTEHHHGLELREQLIPQTIVNPPAHNLA